jgi:hypothetical protein
MITIADDYSTEIQFLRIIMSISEGMNYENVY